MSERTHVAGPKEPETPDAHERCPDGTGGDSWRTRRYGVQALPPRWLELSRTRVVRGRGAFQAAVIIMTAACLVVFTSTGWLVALVVGVVVSLAINAALALYRLMSPCGP